MRARAKPDKLDRLKEMKRSLKLRGASERSRRQAGFGPLFLF
jgi:hypothetical protein